MICCTLLIQLAMQIQIQMHQYGCKHGLSCTLHMVHCQIHIIQINFFHCMRASYCGDHFCIACSFHEIASRWTGLQHVHPFNHNDSRNDYEL
jgi:hypothetical protein